MARKIINTPGAFHRWFTKITENINANFEELYSGGSSYDGDPTVINQDATHRFATDAEKTSWNSKAAGTHSHSISDVTSLQTTLDGKASGGHNHAGVYEPANANIQAHVASTHAPSNAQANADITKAEIETKLTGEISSHTHPGSSAPTVATLSGNQATGANTTPVTLTGLTFNFVANGVYRIWFMGRVQPTAATTGCGFQFDLSVAVTSIDVQFFHQLASTGTLSGGHSIADDASVGVSSGMPATSTYPVTGFGLLRAGANGGSAQLRFRSETTAVTTCMAGFTLVVEKIA